MPEVPAGPPPVVEIRPLTSAADYAACIEIQRRVWGRNDLEITPPHQLRVSVYMGAILLGAFVDGVPVGYVYSYPAVFRGRTIQHSHHLAVLPESQGLGLGKTLKWAQRDEALTRGYTLITWTYDPLQARNANLNLHTLGASGAEYLEDFYGPTPSLVLEPGVATDRLLVEWELGTRRVMERISAAPAALDPESLPKALSRRPDGPEAAPAPRRPDFSLEDPVVAIEIPRSVRDLKGRGGLIAAWQTAVRAAFVHYFRSGYVLDDFVFGPLCYYVLRRV